MLIIKIDADTQNLLTRAAAITGMPSINSFMLNAATEKAKDVIECENTLRLSQADAMLLMEVLDRPTMELKTATNRVVVMFQYPYQKTWDRKQL